MVKPLKRMTRKAIGFARKVKVSSSALDDSPTSRAAASSSLSAADLPSPETCLEKPSERLKKLRNAVDSGGKQANANFLAYLAILVYFFVAVTSTTHEDLLRETPKAVPFLNIQLPLWWFFAVGPAALVLIHLNLLSQYFYLTQNVLRFDQFISKLIGDKAADAVLADEEREIPLNFVLSNLILDRDMPSVLRLVMQMLLWFFVVCAPFATLLLFQGYFIPFHDPIVTWTQRGLLLSDVLLLLLLWQSIAMAQNNYHYSSRYKELSVSRGAKRQRGIENREGVGWRGGELDGKVILKPSMDIRKVFKIIPWSLGLSLFCVTSSLLFLTIPNEGIDHKRHLFVSDLELRMANWSASETTRRIKELLKILDEPFKRNLYLPSKLLFKSDPPPELLAQYSGSLDRHDDVLIKLVKDYGLGLKLKGRDLEGGNFAAARLLCADLDGANLRGARLSGAILTGANLQNAHLEGQDLTVVHLEDVNLKEAYLSNVLFMGANFQGKNLAGIHFEGAKLTGAHFEGAKLMGAHFEGAKLMGAHFADADLQGSILADVSLINADLKGSHLEGVNLRGAHLEGADLRGAHLEGAFLWNASLECADLRGAFIFGTLAPGANFRGSIFLPASIEYSDFRGALFDLID